jgi:histidine kinase
LEHFPLYRSLAFKLGICVGLLTLISILVFAYFTINARRTEMMDNALDQALRFSETLTNSLRHDMGKHDVEGIDSIVQTVGGQEGIALVRIFDHDGQVRFCNKANELGRSVDQKAETCYACHSQGRPFEEVGTSKRTRTYSSPGGERVLGMITPIYNERTCFSATCHVHPESKRVLGILDVGVSLEKTDRAIADGGRKTLVFALLLFLGTAALLGFALVSFVGKPLRRMMAVTKQISQGDYGQRVDPSTRDELRELAECFNRMSEQIAEREYDFRHSREEYRTLFENVPTYIAVVDRNYRIVQANHNFKRTFGYHVVGERCFHVYKGREEKCQGCPVEQTFLDGQNHQSQETGITREAEEIQYLVYTAPITDRDGRVLYAIEMSVDLRKTKRLEKELRSSREFLDNLIENSIHGIVAVDDKERVIVFNRTAERLLGYEGSEVVGSMELERFFPWGFSRKIRAVLDGRLSAEEYKTVAQETWLHSKSGERIPVRFSSVILTEDEAAVGAVGFFQDLRSVKELEREKAQAERLAVVGQTVAALAHGIKNIITGLEGGVYVIETGMKRQDDSLLQKGWGMVERNIDKISRLVKDLLSYSRVGVKELQTGEPNALVKDVCSLFDEKAELSGAGLTLDLDPGVGKAVFDPEAIHSCLTNLIANAIDACAEDKGRSEHRVVVRTRREPGGALVFEVEDNGIGMDEEVREKLFRNFFTTKGTKGTGLGLMVTHKLVHEHGGQITVDSQLGVGSCFRIIIPQEEGEAP